MMSRSIILFALTSDAVVQLFVALRDDLKPTSKDQKPEHDT